MSTLRFLSSTVAFGLLLALAAPPAVLGQESAEKTAPGTVVFSQNMCEDLAKVHELDSIFQPILDEMMTEGKLLGWGVLEHAWGDEWNWNIYYAVESHAAFLEFWKAYIAKLNERHPDWRERTRGLCTAHKDNIYSVHVMH